MGGITFSRAAAWSALAALTLWATQVLAQSTPADPAAIHILQRMTGYLAGLQRFSVETDNTVEDVLDTGQKIQYDLAAVVTIQRPNKLRAERRGDLVSQVVLYDGKTLTVHNRSENYYAVAEAPDNLDSMLRFARDTLDIVPPVGDLIYRNAFELLTARVTSGEVVGKSMVGGVRCDHLAFRAPNVDWQIWIADGDQPLPRKYVITTTDDPAQPQYSVIMNNWVVEPKGDDAMFRFNPPSGAKQTEFIRLGVSTASDR